MCRWALQTSLVRPGALSLALYLMKEKWLIPKHRFRLAHPPGLAIAGLVLIISDALPGVRFGVNAASRYQWLTKRPTASCCFGGAKSYQCCQRWEIQRWP